MKPGLFLLLVLLLIYWWWPLDRDPGPHDTSPPTLSLPTEVITPAAQPRQVSITPIPWVRGNYAFQAVATFTIDAVLLDKASYGDGMSKLTPMDYAVAWGPMHTKARRGKDVEISMYSRTYQFRYRTEKFSASEVANNTANIHLIPKDNDTFSKLKDVKAEQTFRLVGYLVNVRLPDGIMWRSSLNRTDTGAGACELLWVEDVQIAP